MRNQPTLTPMFEELRGERVLVRPHRPSDAEEHFAAVEESRHYLLPWLPWAARYASVDDSRQFINACIARWYLRDDFIVGVWDVQTGCFLGGSGLHPRQRDVPSYEIGYWLRRSAEGHGYMTETVKLLADYAFASLGANSVFIRCDARNTRSIAIPTRLGFPLEGHLRRDGIAYDGAVRDTLIFNRTPDDPRWPS